MNRNQNKDVTFTDKIYESKEEYNRQKEGKMSGKIRKLTCFLFFLQKMNSTLSFTK